MKRDQFWILDGHGLIFRAIFSPGAPLTSPVTREPTRGTYIFTRRLLSLVEEHKPAYLAMAMDAPRSTTFRRMEYPPYKANRDGTELPEDATIQLERIKQIVKVLGVPMIGADTFEADDVIATLADICAGKQVEVVICSADKDMNQLITRDVRQYDPNKEAWIDEKAAAEKWGVPIDRILDVQTLAGDSTDGVPGVRGIGIKTAVELVTQYGGLGGVLHAAQQGELTPARSKAILAADLNLCRRLVELRRDVPTLGWKARDLEFDKLDTQAALPLFRKLGMQSLL